MRKLVLYFLNLPLLYATGRGQEISPGAHITGTIDRQPLAGARSPGLPSFNRCSKKDLCMEMALVRTDRLRSYQWYDLS